MRTARLRRLQAIGLLLLTTTCAPQPTAEPAPSPATGTPQIRVALLTGASRIEVGSDRPLQVRDADGTVVAAATAGRWRVTRSDDGLEAAPADGGPALRTDLALAFEASGADGWLSVNGRGYRGQVTIIRDPSGITAVNTVQIEEYLVSVVGSEMGRRDEGDAEALAAQAIVARTFALRNLGKRAAQGYDLLAGVADQVYGGLATEYPLAASAVTRTAGQVVTYQGALIDVFFFSTCAGQTAEGTEVFAAAARPYLQGIHDTDPAGEPYCRISPRFRWRVEWSDTALRETLRQSLPSVIGTPAEVAATVSGVSVSRRTVSDRVSRVTIETSSGPVTVDGPSVRLVLRPPGESALRSALFHLAERREAGQLRSLIADGAGAGHGVGFCQWGAVGRARQGQGAPAIVAAYFPGTTISQAY